MNVRLFFEDSQRSRTSIFTHTVKRFLEAENVNPNLANQPQNIEAFEKSIVNELTSKCTKTTSYSEETCKDIVNNGLSEICDLLSSLLPPGAGSGFSCDHKRKTLDFSGGYPWYYGLAGMAIGGIMVIGLFAVVYWMCVKKKGPKEPKSKAPKGTQKSTMTQGTGTKSTAPAP